MTRGPRALVTDKMLPKSRSCVKTTNPSLRAKFMISGSGALNGPISDQCFDSKPRAAKYSRHNGVRFISMRIFTLTRSELQTPRIAKQRKPALQTDRLPQDKDTDVRRPPANGR